MILKRNNLIFVGILFCMLFIATASAVVAPVASFSKNSTGGPAPSAIAFTDTSTGPPTSYKWNFTNVSPGNGTVVTFSTSQNPTYTFGVGNWSITLWVSNAKGNNITPVGDFVNVSPPPPGASFTANATTGTAPTVIQFIDTSTNTPTGWVWNATNTTGNNTAFTFSTSQNPTYTFSIGNWSIVLNASNAIGNNISSQKTFVNVSVRPSTVRQYNYTVGSYNVSKFNLTTNVTDNITWTVPSGVTNISVFVVAGGGAGGGGKCNATFGRNYGGGGGAGGIITQENRTVSEGTTITLTIGGGGYGVTCDGLGQNGFNSSFDTTNTTGNLTAIGGGGGAGAGGASAVGASGGSGGGAGGITPAPLNPGSALQTSNNGGTGYGYRGGYGYVADPAGGGGGGGAGGVGANGTASVGGVGGLCINNNWTGTATNYSAGGGSNRYQTSSVGGCPDTGGTSSTDTTPPVNGTYDTGSGGGGSWSTLRFAQGGTGSIIIRYLSGGGGSAPTSSFTIDKTLVRMPNRITVNDTSNNTPTSWIWYWGDGTANTTTNNATHQYLKRGWYNISFTATNAFGSSVNATTRIKVIGYTND